MSPIRRPRIKPREFSHCGCRNSSVENAKHRDPGRVEPDEPVAFDAQQPHVDGRDEQREHGCPRIRQQIGEDVSSESIQDAWQTERRTGLMRRGEGPDDGGDRFPDMACLIGR